MASEMLRRNSTLEMFHFLGRTMIALVFLGSGIGKLPDFDATLVNMVDHGLPVASMLLVLSIAIEIMCALSIMIGWKSAIAASVLFVWMIPVTLVFHGFWSMPAERQAVEMAMFMKNVAIMGGLVLVAVSAAARGGSDTSV